MRQSFPDEAVAVGTCILGLSGLILLCVGATDTMVVAVGDSSLVVEEKLNWGIKEAVKTCWLRSVEKVVKSL